jgi:pyruvate,water dikinase
VPPFFVIAFKKPQEIYDIQNQNLIMEQCRDQKFDLMAVRSSATCEDSPQASFAGMFKTVLGARPPELIGAITEVLNSVSSKRVVDYCEAQGLVQNKIQMAVIVQKMINSRVSGVCFTQLQNDGKLVLVEACYGLGEVIVSGKVTPDSYVVDRDNLSVIRESIGYQKLTLTIRRDSEKPAYEEIPFHKRNARKLTYNEVKAITKVCLSIEEHLRFGPADVEWALEGETLYILQARPYTGGML